MIPVEAGVVVKRPDAPTCVYWQASDPDDLQAVAVELNAPIERVVGRKKLYRVSVRANDYYWWTWPENLRRLAAA